MQAILTENEVLNDCNDDDKVLLNKKLFTKLERFLGVENMTLSEVADVQSRGRLIRVHANPYFNVYAKA